MGNWHSKSPTESDRPPNPLPAAPITEQSLFLPEQRTALFLLWLKRSSLLYHSLSCNIIREIVAYESDVVLLVLAKFRLLLYNPSTDEVISPRKVLFLPPDPFFCVVTVSEVLAVSMSTENKPTVWMNLVSWECREFAELPGGKFHPAALVALGWVYTFGGRWPENSQSSCEKVSPQCTAWKDLPALSRPQNPTACRLNWDVYLPDSTYFHYLDIFNLRSESFRTIALTMKVAWLPVAVISRGILTLLGDGKHIAQWSIYENSKEMTILKKKHVIAGPSSCVPLCRGGKWIWINHTNAQLHIYDPESQRVGTKGMDL